MNQVPFLANFAKSVPITEFLGKYDPAQQMNNINDNNLFLSHTVTETGTGGHNDTDSDTDR